MGKNSLYSCYIASEILSLLCSQIKKKIYHLTHMGSLKTHTAKTLLRILNDNWLERVMQLMYPQYKLWKILKEMGIPDHLICLLRNLYAGQEATVKTGHGTTDWFQMGKGVPQGCILSPYLFKLGRVHHEKCWAGRSTG